MNTAARIRKAALARFASQGYAATSLATIASDAGIKKPSIYTHFSRKQELFHSLLKVSVHKELGFASEQILRPAPPADTLRALFVSTPSRYAASPCLRFWIQAVFLPPPALVAEISDYEGMYTSGLKALVRLALDRRPGATEEKSETLARAYVGILKGLYTELLRPKGRTHETLEALWAVYLCALEDAKG